MIKTVPNDEFFSVVLETLADGCTANIPVKGVSMLPFIVPDRDKVVLEAPAGSFRRGDIVLFRFKGNYVLHRVMETDGENYVMMGDGNVAGTESCTAADIKAKAIAVVRNGKSFDPYSKSWMRRWHVWMALKPIRRYLLFIIRRCV